MRRYSKVVAARFTSPERHLIGAAAEAEGVTVSTFLRRIVLPAVREKVGTVLAAGGDGDGGTGPAEAGS